MSHSFLHDVIATTAAVTIALHSLPLRAQAPCVLNTQPDLARVEQMIEFYPEPMPGRPPTTNGGVFVQKTITLTVKQGQRVWLTGTTLDVTLPTADIIEIKAMPSGKIWHFEYRHPTWTKILTVSQPHNITSVFFEGENTITVQFADMQRQFAPSAPRYWFLIENGGCTSLPLVPVTATPVATLPPSPTPSPLPTETPLPTATAIPTAITTPQVKHKGAADKVLIVAAPTEPPATGPRQPPPHPGRLLTLTILAVIVIRKAWNARPRKR